MCHVNRTDNRNAVVNSITWLNNSIRNGTITGNDFFKLLYLPSLLILHRVAEHLIEDALCEAVEVTQLRLLQPNQFVYLVKLRNDGLLNG